ncbi:MAG TPA: type IV secretion system DNA-binding domain-containing protein [Candidatus Dormibacteraeota bacterium]
MRRGRNYPVLERAEHLWSFSIPFAVGLALGFVALVALRSARLRWTWALLGAPLAYLLWFLDWQAGLCCASATATTAGAGLYWHLKDIERGGEEARAVREAIGPFHAARSWAAQRRVSQQRVQPARRDALGRAQEDRLALGRTRKGGVYHVPLGLSRGVHAFVIGATGAGKTVTQAAIAQAHILAGHSVIVIDPKGDRYLCDVLQEAAKHAGVRFRGWSPTARAVYNPFARGGPTEITDKALAGHRWSEPHYELATQRLLLHVLTTMQAAGQWPPTLSGIVRHMDPDRLDLLAQGVGGDLAARVSDYVDGLSARGRSDLGGGRDRLAVLSDGELGPRLDPALGKGPQINLAESLRRREVVYFHMDADRFPAASQLLGAALVIDLVTLTADMQGSELGGLLVMDEFAALAAEQVSRLFGRARSAGLSVLLGTQSLADLRGARPDDDSDTLTEQVLTNIEFAVVHREADPDSAERLARMAGTRPAWSTTEKVGGRRDLLTPREGTRTRAREFVVLPDEIKRLATGEAVLINPTAKTPEEIVRIFAPRELNGGG